MADGEAGDGRPAGSGLEGLQDVKNLLNTLTDHVLSADVERATAIAANQLLNGGREASRGHFVPTAQTYR